MQTYLAVCNYTKYVEVEEISPEILLRVCYQD